MSLNLAHTYVGILDPESVALKYVNYEHLIARVGGAPNSKKSSSQLL